MKLRIVKARTATADDLRVAAEKVPSPARDRIQEHQQPAQARRSDAPAPPNMVDYIRKDK